MSKAPPSSILQSFLSKFGRTMEPRAIWFDQCGELGRSMEVKSVCNQHHYNVKITRFNAAWQNEKVERYNETLGVMMQLLLYSTGLNATFWSQVLVHAVYMKNCLYNSDLKMTPYEAWMGIKPTLAH